MIKCIYFVCFIWKQPDKNDILDIYTDNVKCNINRCGPR
jgi:hypothetical protein